MLFNFHRNTEVMKRKLYFLEIITYYDSYKIKVIKENSLKLKFKDIKRQIFSLFIYACLFLQSQPKIFQQMEAEFLILFFLIFFPVE